VIPIISVRDLSEVIPATFQERARNQRVETWADFLSKTQHGRRGKGSFWRLQNVPALLKTWQKFVPGEDIRLVTVAPRAAGENVILERFGQVLGVEIAPPSDPNWSSSNRSLGVRQLRILQDVNRLTREQLEWSDYARLIKFRLVSKVMAQAADDPRLVLAESERSWVEAATKQTIETIHDSGCEVVGDLADLGPARFAEFPPDPDQLSADEITQAAAETILKLALQGGEQRSPASEVVRREAETIGRRSSGVRSIYRRYASKPLVRRWKHTVADALERTSMSRRSR
jgi:hypothetical protein